MTRRLWLLVAVAPRLRADAAREAWDAVADAMAALGQGNAARFLAAFDPAMPGFSALRADVAGLVAGFDVQASIDAIDSAGDDAKWSLELDWLLRITERNKAVRATRRRERVKCRLEKQGKRWRIVWFEPLALFTPPRL